MSVTVPIELILRQQSVARGTSPSPRETPRFRVRPVLRILENATVRAVYFLRVRTRIRIECDVDRRFSWLAYEQQVEPLASWTCEFPPENV